MVVIAASLGTLIVFALALAVIGLTLRGNMDKVVRALAGLPVMPEPPLPARRMRVTIRRPVTAPRMPLRAAA